MKALMITITFISFTIPTLIAQPGAMFTLDLTDFCDSLIIRVTDHSSGAEEWTYIYQHTETIISNDQNPQFKVGAYSDDLFMTVTQIVTNQNGSDTLVWDVTPPPYFNEHITYDQDLLTFQFSPANGGYSNQYMWDFGDGNTSNEKEAVHQYNAPGTYEVSLRAIGADVCGDPITYKQVHAVAIPEVDFQSTSTSVCAGNLVDFIDNTEFADSLTWHFEGGTPAVSTENNPEVTYQNGGDFDVTLIASNESFADTLILKDYIQVTEKPVSDFYYQIVGKDVGFNNESEWATDYYWTFDDGITSTKKDPVHPYEEAGTYKVTLIASNNCGSDTITYFVHIPKTTADRHAKVNPFKVYPNPFNEELHLNWQQTSPQEGVIQLHDLTGKTIWESSLKSGLSQKYKVPTGQLQNGVYILNIKTQNDFYSERIYHID